MDLALVCISASGAMAGKPREGYSLQLEGDTSQAAAELEWRPDIY
jgi:hypothetical protein